eukprot:TRINITY_DN1264_c1_g5_i1.p1 TRINITY_DN1264_c1_g5~~TRINITY_DN1264_c1_g5_i1.p1  ORF type:complete len:271 (+),score=32.70 TRINITY_DN1264_c1_g5_i1:204-1016(+)
MRAAIFCALVWVTFARRAEIRQASRTLPDINDTMLVLGKKRKGQALLPGLVPPAGSTYSFQIIENSSFVARNDFHFVLSEVCQEDVCEQHAKGPFMKARGNSITNIFGKRAVNIHDSSGKRIFKVRSTKRMTNPYRIRRSFRIFPPHTSDKHDVLFTINGDFLGQVFFKMKQEWRIYRGRAKDKDQIYFGVGGYFRSWSTTNIYKIPGDDFKEHPDKHVGTVAKKKKKDVEQAVGDVVGAGDSVGGNLTLEVKGSEDAGLLLVFAMILDM